MPCGRLSWLLVRFWAHVNIVVGWLVGICSLKSYWCFRMYLFAYNLCETSNMTGRHQGPKRKLQAGYTALRQWRARCHQSYFCLLDVPSCMALYWPTTLQFYLYVYVSLVCCRVWYRALSLRYVCIGSSAIIFTPRLLWCQISFLSHSPSLS